MIGNYVDDLCLQCVGTCMSGMLQSFHLLKILGCKFISITIVRYEVASGNGLIRILSLLNLWSLFYNTYTND